MNKKPLSKKQKILYFNIIRILSYGMMIFGAMMNGFQSPLFWVSLVLVIGNSIFRVMAIRCPECDELIPSNFGIIAKSCSKCGWNVKDEDKPKETPEA